MSKDTVQKILVEISRIILGVTFVFSGFVKSVDPCGTVYKIEDYLSAFHLSSLDFLALPCSFLLCGAEFIMGAFMLLGIYRRRNSRLMLIVMCFMTPLTLYLAIANPVEDCGCFGDVLKITNWQTFFKNIILLLCAVITFKYYEKIGNFFTGKTYWLAFLYIIIFICLFMARNYYLDPVFDFRPYKIGANIPQLMNTKGKRQPVTQTVLVYQKDGKEKTFTEDNYPWQDSAWTFVKMDTKILEDGELPDVKDFSLNNLTFDNDINNLIKEQDITNEVLSDTGYVFLMISPNLFKMRENHISSFEDVANYAKDYHYKFYCLTASGTNDIMNWEKENLTGFNFCVSDERMLKTVIRTNPGLLLIKNGVIINKWPDIKTPAEENLNASLENLPYSKISNIEEEDKQNLYYISAILLLPLMLLKGLDLFFYSKKNAAKVN